CARSNGGISSTDEGKRETHLADDKLNVSKDAHIALAKENEALKAQLAELRAGADHAGKEREALAKERDALAQESDALKLRFAGVDPEAFKAVGLELVDLKKSN